MMKKAVMEKKTKAKAEQIKEPLSKEEEEEEEEALLQEVESCRQAKGKRKTARAKAWRHRGVNPDPQESGAQ